MKKYTLSVGVIVFIILCNAATSNAQYYLRGQVKDELGRALPNVKINLFSKGNYSYKSGSSGGFGIPTHLEVDTIILTLVGYETFKKAVVSNQYQDLVLKMLPATASLMKNKLSSKTKNLLKEQHTFFSANGESYSSLIENDFVNTQKYPETGFSVNIDRASYSNARRFLNNDINVPTNAVRIEEMLNYFDFRSPNETPKEGTFLMNQFITTCPWNKENRLLFLKLNAPKLNLDKVPPSNLVFLIDISGSMDKPNRLPLLQSAFKMLTDNLRNIDTVAIVVYGGGVYRVLNPTSGAKKETIKNVIDSLTAAGDTPGESAIQTAYQSARSTFIKGGNNRVILATDGDFNIGVTSEKALEDLIAQEMRSGIYLTCLGVGMGNYKDSKLETLAKKGNGNFAYIDNIYEAQKVLVTEFTKTMYAVANDAFFIIQFNSAAINDYRLIGFDNKRASIEDSTSELEGGEVGSGHTMLAIFEINSTNQQFDSTQILGKATLQYKFPNASSNTYQYLNIQANTVALQNADSSLRFATAVAMFGSLLKKSKYADYYNFTDVYNMAASAVKPNDYAQQEFLKLVQKANKLYNIKKKKL
jgi:Ca-activated chloride channel family protein